MIRPSPRSPLFPYTTLFRSVKSPAKAKLRHTLATNSRVSPCLCRRVLLRGGFERSQRLAGDIRFRRDLDRVGSGDRKSTRLNSSHTVISYAVFCLKKKK